MDVEARDAAVPLRYYSDGEHVFRQGDTGHGVFKVQSGGVRVFVGSEGDLMKPIAVLSVGEVFGGLGRLSASSRSESRRTATCIAEGDTVLECCPEMAVVESGTGAREPSRANAFSVAAGGDSGSCLAAKRTTERVAFCPGDVIVEQCDEGDDAFFVIEEGLVDVFVDNLLVNTMVPGEIFGETVILSEDRRRTASCRARDACQILRVHVDREMLLQDENSEIMRMLRRRRDEILSKPGSHASWTCVLSEERGLGCMNPTQTKSPNDDCSGELVMALEDLASNWSLAGTNTNRGEFYSRAKRRMSI
jgi:CRP-like cAMP-binding protein